MDNPSSPNTDTTKSSPAPDIDQNSGVNQAPNTTVNKPPYITRQMIFLTIAGIVLLIIGVWVVRMYWPHNAKAEANSGYTAVTEAIKADLSDFPRSITKGQESPKFYHACESRRRLRDTGFIPTPTSLWDGYVPSYYNECRMSLVWKFRLGDNGIEQTKQIIKTLYEKGWRSRVYTDKPEKEAISLKQQLSEIKPEYNMYNEKYVSYDAGMQGTHIFDQTKYIKSDTINANRGPIEYSVSLHDDEPEKGKKYTFVIGVSEDYYSRLSGEKYFTGHIRAGDLHLGDFY